MQSYEESMVSVMRSGAGLCLVSFVQDLLVEQTSSDKESLAIEIRNLCYHRF